MSAQTKRHLANINQSLRAEHNNLKSTKDHLLDHIGGLIKREKQLKKLKQDLAQELTRCQQQVKIQQKTKEPLCLFLKEELSHLDKKYIEGSLRLRNLENQYQICLQDYQKVIEVVTHLIEGAQGTQSELTRLKESDITMKAMIFDCERLKRVLEEEKRYFKQLCSSQQKTHAERLKELESIRKNIQQEEDSSTCSIRLTKLHIGMLKLGNFFDKRLTAYKQTLLKEEGKETKMVKIGIKSIENCLNIGSAKMLQNKRSFFRVWHNKAFPKHILRDLTQRALNANEESRIRLKTLGLMEEKILTKNTQMLHLYEKIKYMITLSNKLARKDRHYGFNLWRQQCRGAKKLSNVIETVFGKVLTNHLKRFYFNEWNKRSSDLKRIEVAAMLLKDFEDTKQLARCFRKWRFQLLNHEERCIRYYIQRLKDQQLITKRLNYEKRKMKVLTILHLKVTKIQLRTYFYKYWSNVKSYRAQELTNVIEKQRQQYSQNRKEFLAQKTRYEVKDKSLLLHIFRDFIYKNKNVPVYKQWKNEAQHFKKQKRSLMSLVLRKQAKNKIYVMNQFRKCVQYYQKKEMHQVLTDLNHKMEAINQKSTQFRESLKTCIENLGIIASKKMDTVTNFIYDYQKRLVYNTYNSNKIKKAYKVFHLSRMLSIFYSSCGRRTFGSIREYVKLNKEQIQAERKATNYYQGKIKDRYKKIFMWLKRQAIGHNQGFARMIHIENVFIFYRLTYAFAAIKRVYTAQKYKAMHKYLEDQGSALKEKQQNLANTINTREGCQKSLLQFFGKFVTYEDRKRRIKIREQTHSMLSKYLKKFRQNVHNDMIRQKTVENIGDIVTNNNKMIFFRNLLAIRYQQLLQTVKEQLAKINKKRKTFEQKNEKIRADMLKRIEEEVKVYNQCKEYHEFYTKRYESILNYYSKRTANNQQEYIKKQIFISWKYQYVTSKRLIKAIDSIYRRIYLKEPCELAMNVLRGRINKAKAQDMIALMLQRKGNKLVLDALSLWKCNVQKFKQAEIQKRLDNLDDYEEEMKEQIKQRAELISMEVPRVRHRKLIATVFMGFKQVWLKTVTNRRKIQPMLQRRKQNLVKDAMVRWKWDLFFIRTERAYVQHKKDKYEHELKRDVFNSFKFYRFTIYNIVNKIKAINNNQLFKIYHNAFDKIRNEAANERDELNYERRRALFTLLSAKIAKLQRIKQKILMKWNAHLIPRYHYLPSIIKRCELNTLKSAFALINEKKYWNEVYIKDIADEVTSDGYNEINQVTNSLMREGYDPDQIKQYLKKRNDKDLKILDGVIKHFRMWAHKEVAVRAFHSWKQYLRLKQDIKKSLTKVFNIAGGIGKYWARWRTKDAHFNEILKKQSRGNMLNRFRELSRLLKEYHRDIRDNTANLEQLRDINKEYKDKNKMAIIMALNVFSNSVKRGLLQGFNLWRNKIHEQKRVVMDQRYDQIISALEMLNNQKSKLRYNIGILRQENKQLKQKCMWGVQCGKILESLLTEKDSLSIDLADKQHNLKLLLEDNLRLKQKMKLAKNNAQQLIRKVEEQTNTNA